jgi:hypothetical protein
VIDKLQHEKSIRELSTWLNVDPAETARLIDDQARQLAAQEKVPFEIARSQVTADREAEMKVEDAMLKAMPKAKVVKEPGTLARVWHRLDGELTNPSYWKERREARKQAKQ